VFCYTGVAEFAGKSALNTFRGTLMSATEKRQPVHGSATIPEKQFWRTFLRPGAIMKSLQRAAVFTLFLLLLPGCASVEAKNKISVGTAENVVLLPWGVQMPARIDTGAATSSLDARNLVIRDRTAEFNLPPQYGGRRISLPIVNWKTVKSATAKARRPVVVVEMCISNRRIRTNVNLVDRSNVKYPLLIGRNTLVRDFVVECSTSFCTQPSCPEVYQK
jgi:hypothetical protein